MRDGPVRRIIKRIALAFFIVNVSGTRGLLRLRGEKPHRLGGQCRLCARCCEAPAIQVGRLLWYLPTLRRLFLFWQRVVNGFELTDRVISQRLFVFRCTHFDWETRRCDSYDSRPGMCRDYPRVLLHQANPEFLPGCGYRAIAPGAEKLLAALEQEGLPPEKLEELKEKLHLKE